MGIGGASDFDPTRLPRGGGTQKVALFAAKLLVTAGCFWYVSQQIDLNQVLSAVPLLDFRWMAFAVFVVILQIPLLGVRWCRILDGLRARNAQVTLAVTIAVSAIGVFFAQVLPSVAGEGVRAWLVVRLGCGWRNAVTSVVIDRGVGAALLIMIGFVVLLVLSSSLTALGGYREIVLVLYGGLLLAATFGLVFAPTIASRLSRWRYSRWFAILAVDARRVLFGPYGPVIVGIGCLVHALTIVIIWSLGRAQGLLLPVADAATLFTVMISVALVPISIGGWGLRELAVISLLGNHGVPPDKAMLFSVCFGLTLAVGSLPGALAWLLYSFVPARRSREAG